MIFKETDIAFVTSQLARIDRGEESVFRDTMNTDNQIIAKIFIKNELNEGVFYSCQLSDDLPIHIGIAIVEDTDRYNREIEALIHQTIQMADRTSCSVWLRNENKKITKYLKKTFHIVPELEGEHDYASIEFIMQRDKFAPMIYSSEVEIRPYEDVYIDDYLLMLDDSMTFASPPPDFVNNKNFFLGKFSELNKQNAFEAFWVRDKLVGLYWRNGEEIDVMAVAGKHQRKGYGSIILTRALQRIFVSTNTECAYLYAVDWNERAQAFYRKYGMVENGHSRFLRLEV